MDLAFNLSNLLVLPFWLLMMLLPHWPWTRRIVSSPLIVAPPAVLYTGLLIPQLGGLLPLLASPSAAGVAGALGTPAGATIAWAHFVTFDLFVGRWAYLDSCERGLSAWVMAPVLFAILMVGPLGLLIYLGARALLTRGESGDRRS